MVLETLAMKAAEKVYGEKKKEQSLEEQRESLAQTKIDTDGEGTLQPGETRVFSFKGRDANDSLGNNYPFESVDVFNDSGGSVAVEVNENRDLSVPVPAGAQNGDSFDKVGINRIRVRNTGSTAIDVPNLQITVSGSPGGVERGSI